MSSKNLFSLYRRISQGVLSSFLMRKGGSRSSFLVEGDNLVFCEKQSQTESSKQAGQCH